MSFLRFITITIVFFALLPLCVFGGAQSLADETYTVVIDRNVPVKVRDGVTLHADVYRPKAEGKFPVILTRTPYDKTGSLDTCMRVAATGYVCVAQDCRGRYASEGEWYPFKHESEDGYDTIEWLAHQPYSTGVIGMWGASYVGATQLLAAIARPPHLAGLFVIVTASDYHENWAYQGGAFEQWFNESWTSGLAEDTMRRKTIGSAGSLQWSKAMPLANYPVIAPADAKDVAPYFQDWLAHPNDDDYWKQWSIEADYSRINIPVFHIGAWYDIFLGGTLRNYAGMKAGAGNDFSRSNQRLLVEIGGHSGNGRKVGEVDFGPQAEYDEAAVMLRWYDFLFKNILNGMERDKPVRLFTMGLNQWRGFDAWPPPGAKTTRMFLHSAGKANTSAGDGALNSSQPGKEPVDHYLYNPNDAVPTHGGPLCCAQSLLPPGPRDQAAIEKRPDVLVYTSAPLKQDLDVTGPVTLDLFVQSSGPDTDFTGKLVDVWPNGFAQNITEGILRMRYRDSRSQPSHVRAGEIYKITVDLWATSNVFLAGHKLRIEISSSNYPRFDRNLNTGDPDIAHATRVLAATNTILHDRAHPSAVVLSVLADTSH
ncbi:MAG TPA: CocE/NonD family hydrolase [Candidatus Acidoferrales bacterium]|nr:CocE/NonD family hydrolase [Candidatus Acidoferrales bacterium]